MQLSKRLNAVAELVTPGNRVADIGCDHAYTSIYLAENEISPHIIAMDVNQGPIDRATENIIRYGYRDRIETRKSDGLQKLSPGEADTVLIAGMGGALAIEILMQKPEVLKELRELVLQPQSELTKVRQMLSEQNFLIIKENMVKEDGKFYIMLKAVHNATISDPEKYRLVKEEHFSYGRLLLEQKHSVLFEFLEWEYRLNEGILDTLHSEQTENAKSRQIEIENKMKLIQLGLEYFK